LVAHVSTIAFVGIEGRPVDVQVHVAGGLPAFTVVGLPDKAVAESRERVRSALSAVGLALPPKRITVNLAPADLPKEGSHYDLPIAMGLLVALGVVAQEDIDPYVVIGELGLDGALQAVPGALPATMQAMADDMGIICPAAVGSEAVWAGEVEIIAADHLLSLLNHIKGTQVLSPPEMVVEHHQATGPDLKDIKGQETAKRALEVAAAGGHNILMIGPPGSGKSMLAARLPGLLPPLSPAEALEVGLVRSVAGETVAGEGRGSNGAIRVERPYRHPHHSASMAALTGGGHKARPGEVSLAHRGVLFLDELPEFQRGVLDSLRQPLETGEVVVARANAHVTYPARFQLVAAMNPCRCGHLGDAELACTRAPKCAQDYQAKLSGPLLDRFDLFVEVPAVSATDLTLPPAAEGSDVVASRVAATRQRQQERLADMGLMEGVGCNAEIEGEMLEKIAPLSPEGQEMMAKAVDRLRLTARGYHRVLRVARTIADLDGVDQLESGHLAEALSFRLRPLRG